MILLFHNTFDIEVSTDGVSGLLPYSVAGDSSAYADGIRIIVP